MFLCLIPTFLAHPFTFSRANQEYGMGQFFERVRSRCQKAQAVSLPPQYLPITRLLHRSCMSKPSVHNLHLRKLQLHCVRFLGSPSSSSTPQDTDLDNPPTNACLPTSDAGADGELPAEDRMMNDVAIAPPRTHELQAGVSSGNGTHAINCCRSEESTISNLDHSTLITPEQCYTHGLPSILPARSILATPRRSPTVQKNTTTSAFALCQCKCNRSTGVEGRIEAVDVAEHKAKAMDSAEETQRALDEVKRLRVDVRELVKWRDAVQKVKEMMEAAEALNEARQCTGANGCTASVGYEVSGIAKACTLAWVQNVLV